MPGACGCSPAPARPGGGARVSAPLAVAPAGQAPADGRWHWPIDPRSYDTARAVRTAEAAAIAELGAGDLRRLARCDPRRPGMAC